jgi:hypothetical protein
MTKSNLPSSEVALMATALPRWSRTLSERQLCGPTFPTEGTESAAAGATTGDVLAGVADACTTAGVLLKTVRSGPREQPKIVRRMPVDKNKTAFFIFVSPQSVR